MAVRALLFGVCIVCASVLISPLRAQTDRLRQVLAAAQRALDGLPDRPVPGTMVIKGKRAVKKLVMEGTQRNLTLSVEIYAQFPDKFIWIEDGGTVLRTERGFDGARLITNQPERLIGTLPGSSTSGYALGSVVPDVDQMKQIKADFVGLTFGLFARSMPSVPLVIGDITGGAAANAIGIATQDGYAATVVFDRTSGLPAWLGTREIVDRGNQNPQRIEKRWVFLDYRVVRARRVPTQIAWMATMVDSDVLSPESVLTITEIGFDVAIDPDVFRSRGNH